MPACLNCNIEFPEAPRRGPRPKTFCSRPCQIKAANERRSIKRRGDLSTTGKAPGRPVAPGVTIVPPSASRALSDSPSARISALMALAHSSRGGIDAWQVAELAKLKGVSPWAPLRVIIGQKDGMK